MLLIGQDELKEMYSIWFSSGAALLRAMGRVPPPETLGHTAWDVEMEDQPEEVLRMLRFVARQAMSIRNDWRAQLDAAAEVRAATTKAKR